MNELVKLLIGIVVLILGVPIGNILRKYTKEELKQGRPWFKLIVNISLLLGFIGLIMRNDALMFTMFFITIVTSRSLILRK